MGELNKKRVSQNTARDAEIVSLFRSGKKEHELAAQFSLSQPRISYILGAAKVGRRFAKDTGNQEPTSAESSSNVQSAD